MSSDTSPPPPSSSLLSLHPLSFLPSLLPLPPVSAAEAASTSLRDVAAEENQRRMVWRATNQDLSLLLRLPLPEFLSHLLYNKSLTRLVDHFLSFAQSLWLDAQRTAAVSEQQDYEPTKERIKMYFRTRKHVDDGSSEDGGDDDDTEQSPFPSKFSRDTEHVDLLRQLIRRFLLVYVRLCTIENVSSESGRAPSWLTPSFFTTSFSASSLFSPSALLDLVAFYTSLDRDLYTPLLQCIVDRVSLRLPYAFSQGMQHALTLLLSSLANQVREMMSPYAAGSQSVATGKKLSRFTRSELRNWLANVTGMMWSVYSMCRLRTDVLRLVLRLGNDNGSTSSTSSPPSSSSSSSTPASASAAASLSPFFTLLTALYSPIPLILLHELGLKPRDISGQPELVTLRRACLICLDLTVRKGMMKAMGIKPTSKKREKATWMHVNHNNKKKDGKTTKDRPSAISGMSSTLPPAYTMEQACDHFYSSFLQLYRCVRDDAQQKGHFLFLPSPMRNLIHWATPSAQFAFLRRYLDAFELEQVLRLLLDQARSNSAGTPGAYLGTMKAKELMDCMTQVDPVLMRERADWPEVESIATSSSSSSSGPASSSSAVPRSSAPLSRSTSKSTGGNDLQLAVASLLDLFPDWSPDYAEAALSEFNNDVEATTMHALEDTLPDYLKLVKNKATYRKGDHMDATKLRRDPSLPFGIPQRQTSTGSTGSGLLDEPVDDDDTFANLASSSSSSSPYLDDDAAGFEAFLKRTGRVARSSQTQPDHGGKTTAGTKVGAAAILNAFDRSEKESLVNRIAANMMYEDEYDDGFDDFTNFALDENNPLDIEEHASMMYEGRDDADEPDGSFQSRGRGGRGGEYQRNNIFAATRNNDGSGGRGRGGGRAAGSASSSSSSSIEDIVVPRTFMPELSEAGGKSGGKVDVRDQWRRDEQRRELYIATVKAQRVQQIPPSKRTTQQKDDLEWALKLGLVQDIDPPTPGKAAASGAQTERAGGKQQKQQPQQQPRSARGHDDATSSSSSSSSHRGGFSMRGGRGGSRGGHQLSAAAPAFQPSSPPSSSSVSTSSPPADAVPVRWDEISDDGDHDDDAASMHGVDGGAPSQSHGSSRRQVGADDHHGRDGGGRGGHRGGGRGGRGGHSSGEQGHPMDDRSKRRKEKNKGRVANHNRKAGALRKQGPVQFA